MKEELLLLLLAFKSGGIFTVPSSKRLKMSCISGLVKRGINLSSIFEMSYVSVSPQRTLRFLGQIESLKLRAVYSSMETVDMVLIQDDSGMTVLLSVAP